MAATTFLVDGEGAAAFTLDRAAVERRLRDEGFFWLDLCSPSRADLELLHEVFDLHPLAIEDSDHFGQRAKLEDYDTFVFLVVYGWSPDEDGLVEVHCFYSERFLITVRRDEAPAFDRLRERYGKRLLDVTDAVPLLYQVVDGLVDSFFPALGKFDRRIDAIQDELFARPRDAQLQEIFAMRRQLLTLRRAIVPQRDLFGRLVSGAELPGMTREAERYFRDVYDHLIRLSDLLDNYRDLMTGTIDVYLSSASNRLNAVMKQLAVIATIFLPLSFVAGFFGQNFGWLVEHVDGPVSFFTLGLGLQLLVIGLLLLPFKRRGWF